MKVNIKVLSDQKSVTFDVNETDSIETLNDQLNNHLNSLEDFYFIYNKVICESNKTLTELQFHDDCILYAAKKIDKPLKRKLENDALNDILTHGSFSKKICKLKDEDLIEHSIWQPNNLSDIQKDLTKIVNEDPFLFEPLLLQTPIERMIHQPLIVQNLFSVNPVIGDLMEKKPDQLKFFTDLSQYNWIKNVLTDSSELERLSLHYVENFKNVTDSKRYKRMSAVLERAEGASEEEKTAEEVLEDGLGLLMRAPYSQRLAEMLAKDGRLAAEVVRAGPYGAAMTEEDLREVCAVMPAAMTALQAALVTTGGPAAAMGHLREHPLEVIGLPLAERLSSVSDWVAGARGGPGGDGRSPGVVLEAVGGTVPLTTSGLLAEGAGLLAEMGYHGGHGDDLDDNDDNMLHVLAREYGNVSRAALSLSGLSP